MVINTAISFAQTQDGFLQKVGNALDRMSQLATQALDVTKTNRERSLYDREYQKLGSYINELASKSFNGVSLFNTAAAEPLIDIAATSVQMKTLSFTGSGSVYQLAAGGNVGSLAGAVVTAVNVRAAIKTLEADRANVHDNISALSSFSSQAEVFGNYPSPAKSHIRDEELASESTQFACYNILVQSGLAMLAQANQSYYSALKLLRC